MSQNTEAVVEQMDEESSFEKIGLLFKEARESKNITIAEASQELHIRQLYINSIESGSLSALPGHVYKIGFIKTYARFLNLNEKQILKDFNLQEEIAPDYSSFNYSIPIEHQKRPNIKVILGATTLLFIGSVTLYVSNNTHDEGSVVVSKIDTSAQIQPPPSSVIIPATPTASPAAVDETSSPPSVTPLQPSVTKEQDKEAVTTEENDGVKIIATKDAWVQVTDESGKAVFVRLMRAGESYNVPTTGKYQLNTGNGAGVKLSIGNKISAPLGADGKVIRGISLNIDDIQKIVQ